MKKRMQKLLRSESGQGMTEYIIVVALIAIAAIGVVTTYGNNVRRLFGTSAAALAGQKSETAGTAVPADPNAELDLQNFASGK